jgi:hypothetical protein
MTQQAEIKVYYTQARRRYRLAGAAVAVLAMLVLVLFVRSFGNWVTSIVLAVLGAAAFFIALSLFIGSRSRIVTSAQGLAYHATGFSIFTTWDNIERIDQIPVFQDVSSLRLGFGKSPRIGFAGHIEGLVLRRPVVPKRSVWERGAMGFVHHIALSIEFASWRESELAQDVRRYAPHLFSDQV